MPRKRDMAAESSRRPSKEAGRPEPLPAFANEAEERAFWGRHSTEPYAHAPGEWVTVLRPAARDQFLKLRVDRATLAQLRAAAARRGVGYTVLARMWLTERLAQEQPPASGRKQGAAAP